MELLFANTLNEFTILFLAVLAGFICEKAGVVNIGIEGMMTIGALIFSLCGNLWGEAANNAQILSFLLAGLGGAIFALLHGLVSISLRGNQIISGTAINMLSAAIVMFVVQCYSGGIEKKYHLLKMANIHWLNIYLLSAIIIYAIIIFLFWKTKWGLHHVAVGENHLVAHAVGINVIKKRYLAVFLSGFFAGLGGASFVIFGGTQFLGNLNGKGYIALAILIFGQWKLSLISAACIFFSFLESIILYLSFAEISWLSILINNYFLLMTIPFLAPLLIMICLNRYNYAPFSLGIPFEKDAL